MRRWLIGAVALAFLSLANPGAASKAACSCSRGGLPCEDTWRADAVFVGEALAVTRDPTPTLAIGWPGPMAVSLRHTVRVLEAFRGVSTPLAQVYTDDATSCAFGLELKTVYLIYAMDIGNGRLYASYCSPTRPISQAAEDLAYLRGPARQPAALGTIVGAAHLRDLQPKDAFNLDEEPPYAGGRVVVESLDPQRPATYRTVTGEDGGYAIRVPVGKYRVRLLVRDGLWVQGPFGDVEVLDPRGCAGASFLVERDGRLSGRVLDHEGHPVAALSVELIALEDLERGFVWSRLRTQTDDAGSFEFAQLRPDTYVPALTLSRTGAGATSAVWLTPDSAGQRVRIPIGPEARVWAGELRLPESVRMTRIFANVVDETFKVPADVSVYVQDGSGEDIVAGPTSIDKFGNFSFSVIAGRGYRVVASHGLEDGIGSRRQVRTEPFTATPGAMSLSLRFEK